ncbi:MAG: type 4a pilus biogenesis protein PilO [Candidatus Omnitrophica bacterium]|nr:type 4a pilus biogenesis protein PilO [Candidatus Omnitrophota bacterium]
MSNFNPQAMLKKKGNIVMIVIVLVSLWFAKDIHTKQVLRSEDMKRQIEAEKEKGAALDRIVVLNEKIKKAKEKSWDTIDTNSIIDKIYKVGIDSEVKIMNISPGGRTEEKNYTIISFGIDCGATYKQLIQFIKRLETYPMLIRIRSFSIAPAGDTRGQADPTLSGNIAVEAVYFK